MLTESTARNWLWVGGGFLVAVTAYAAWVNYSRPGGLLSVGGGQLSDAVSIATKIIKQREGCRLRRYNDIAGIPSIGWGHRLGEHENYTQISQDQADQLLLADVNRTYQGILPYLPDGLNNNQIAACISLAFNIGVDAFLSSTLLRLLNSGDYQGAADEFLRWDKAHVNGVLQSVAGLTSRRQAEQQLFLS